MNALSRWWARFRGGFGPVDHSDAEVFCMRLFFAAIVLYSLPDRGDIGGLSSQGHPVGLAHFIDLTWVAGSLETCWWVLAGAMVFYVSGFLVWFALPVGTFVYCSAGALWNSQGITRHTLQVVGLILLVQSVYYVVARIRTWRGVRAVADRRDQHRVAVWFAQQTIAATYVITAVSKSVIAGGVDAWIKKSKFYPLQIEKTRLSDYYNHLGQGIEAPIVASDLGLWERAVAALDGMSLAIQDFLVANPNMCRTFLTAGLALEFFAFLALRGRLSLFLYGLALIGFHLTIGRVMNLHFVIHNLVILTFMINIPFLFLLLWKKMSGPGIPVRQEGSEAAKIGREDSASPPT